jgi:type VI secretion system protein ImpA
MSVEVVGFRFETDRLLSPISADQPTGESLRYEGTYDRIADFRREDDPAIDQGVWKADLKRAEWSRVAQTCLVAIETRSKDIQLAAWLLEAWIHLHGFCGLTEGLHLIAELCDTYWDGLHPQIQDNDLEYRLAPVFWIDEKLSTAVRLVSITAPAVEELPAYSLSDWETASRAAVARGRDATGPGSLTLPRFQNTMTLTPSSWLSRTMREVEAALQALAALHDVLEARAGRQAPSMSEMRRTLDAIHGLLVAALHERHDLPATEPVPDEANGDFTELPADPGEHRPIRTRAEAYQRLSEAAEFLLRTEPHSPVPHLVRRAVSWGSMSLDALLPELVRDNNQLSEILRLLQIGSNKPDKK